MKKRKPSTAAKFQMIIDLLGDKPIYDEYGDDTGKKTPKLITVKQAKKLLELI